MRTEKISYQYNGKEFEGYLAYDEATKSKKPVVLIGHTWMGLDEFVRHKAEQLAELGYLGFAMDMFGKGIEIHDEKEASSMIAPLFIDRAELRGRSQAALEAIKKHKFVDANRIAAIGFCFGGLTVLEMAKSGADLVGVVTFHGVLGDRLGELKANLQKNAEHIKAKVLVLHGHEDPLVSKDQITHFQNEMTEAKVDWQMHIYGHAMHAFSNPKAQNKEHGLMFNQNAEKRSWQSMQNFLTEIFNKTKQ